MLPCIVFMFVWTTIIYDPIACWTWNPSGWVYQLGGLDFAGGTPVHIASGSAALAYSLMLGCGLFALCITKDSQMVLDDGTKRYHICDIYKPE